MNSGTDKSAKFFEAVSKNDMKIVDDLLSSKEVLVDLPNPKNKCRTALHTAAHENYYDLVCLLVEKHHADVNLTDQVDKIPLQLAADRYHMKIVKFLLQKGSNLREYAAHHLNNDSVEEFFEAVIGNDIERVLALISLGVDVDSEDRSNLRRTALEIAAAKGYYELARILVDHNADIEHEDDIDESAYDKAVNSGHENIANFLTERGYKDKYAKDELDSSDSEVNLTCFGLD